MKKLILGGIVILGLVMGCAKISTDGNKIEYSRFGSQNLSDVQFTKDANGIVSLSIGKQESNDLGDALETLSEAIKRIPVAP